MIHQNSGRELLFSDKLKTILAVLHFDANLQNFFVEDEMHLGGLGLHKLVRVVQSFTRIQTMRGSSLVYVPCRCSDNIRRIVRMAQDHSVGDIYVRYCARRFVGLIQLLELRTSF